MQEKHFSRTALGTAYLRAAHQIIDCGPRVLDDPVALPILGAGAEQRIRSNMDRYMSAGAKLLRSHVVLRSRYAEDRLKLSIARDVSQYIIVGAGFDTFAYRQPEWATRIKIYEVDHPDTQQQKNANIAAAGMIIPENVAYVAVDFEKQSLENQLAHAGIDKTRPAFFAWLGVTMYLSEAAIGSTLTYLASFPGGSEAVITFMQPPDELSTSSKLAERVSDAGEPFISFFTCESFEKKLLAAGFSKAEFLSLENSAAYFANMDGALSNPRRISIVSALV